MQIFHTFIWMVVAWTYTYGKLCWAISSVHFTVSKLLLSWKESQREDRRLAIWRLWDHRGPWGHGEDFGFLSERGGRRREILSRAEMGSGLPFRRVILSAGWERGLGGVQVGSSKVCGQKTCQRGCWHSPGWWGSREWEQWSGPGWMSEVTKSRLNDGLDGELKRRAGA